MEIKKAYKFRAYPTKDQQDILARTFGASRFVYNHFLKIRTDAWYVDAKSIGYVETSAMLTLLKKEPGYEWLKEVSSVPVQQSLQHLQTAFKNFWSKRTKYPTFKKKSNNQAITYVATGFQWDQKELYLAKMEQCLKVRFHRTIPKAAKVSSVTVSKDAAGRYFISMLCTLEQPPLLCRRTLPKIGIDVGLTHFATLSTGEKIENPKIYRKYEKKLAILQRRLSKKKKGSKNRNKARLKVAKLHAKIVDSRKDFLHKLSRRLINENQVIAVETLAVKNMVKNPQLAKSISDAGWSTFIGFLRYKAEWAGSGRTLVGIDKWFPSSKRCSCCGFITKDMPLNIRNWKCPSCSTNHDRDINAAINILAAGTAVLALGESVNPTQAYA